MTYLEKVTLFATNAHEGQFRRGSKLPYIVHPLDVAKKVEKYFDCDEHQIAAAILHDTIEDCNITHEQISEKFGLPVADIVANLTSDNDEIKKVGKNVYLISKMTNMNDETFEIKLCDRLSNVEDIPKKKYVDDTLKMMSELKRNRKITLKQKIIMIQIEIVCLQFLLGLKG